VNVYWGSRKLYIEQREGGKWDVKSLKEGNCNVSRNIGKLTTFYGAHSRNAKITYTLNSSMFP
jgi:hypothetical protein